MIIEFSLSQINEVVEKINQSMKHKVILLYGEMGVGKTTFAKEFIHLLGVEKSVISSPTYPIVNIYHLQNGGKIYHLDLFRINKEEELLEIGFEEIFDDFEYILIEWPEIGTGLISVPFHSLSFEKKEENSRRIEFE